MEPLIESHDAMRHENIELRALLAEALNYYEHLYGGHVSNAFTQRARQVLATGTYHAQPKPR